MADTRIVQCHGCFDVLHLGHIRHFEAAKRAGDYLIVTVTPDEFVNKGGGRPVFAQAQRMEAIAALTCVDEVRSSEAPTATASILAIKPAVFAKGPDYSEASMDPEEVAAVKAVGGMLLFTDTEKFSSTALIGPRRRHADEVEAYLSGIRQRHSAADVLAWLEKARSVLTLVVGEAITDEYVYGDTLGKSGKEPILAMQTRRRDCFVGGADAVANHVRAVSDCVDVLTGPPIVKRRYVENYPFQKLFETYAMNEQAQAEAGDDRTDAIRQTPLILVADYGHGFVTPRLRARLTESAGFLAVNVQANAGNHGFNTISKYGTAPDFIALSERELRLDARDQTSDVNDLIATAARTHSATILVTRGERGCRSYDADGFCDAPALTSAPLDRIGAGDAVFAVTACCAAMGMPLEMLTFVAAVVGTLAVGIIGNARYIEREALHAAIRSYLA